MKKNTIRLTESQLHQVIKESVEKILSESVKTPDENNVVDSDLAKKLGFNAEYLCDNGLELWGKIIQPYEYYAQKLLAKLGISRFTSYSISKNHIHVLITVKNTQEESLYKEYGSN